MDEVVGALRDQQAELAGFVIGRGDEVLGRPSLCPGWSVADVLLHLAQTNEMAIASVEGRVEEMMAAAAQGMSPGGDIDDWAGQLVDIERTSPTDARDRWLASAAGQVETFASCDPDARVQWVAGDMAARSLATTRLTETWIHTLDVAFAFGEVPPATDRLRHTVRLVWRTVPYALTKGGITAAGPVGFEVAAPDGSTWSFGMDGDTPPPTVIRGGAVDVCRVAGQRADAADTGLTGEGPDAAAVLRLMRTFA